MQVISSGKLLIILQVMLLLPVMDDGLSGYIVAVAVAV